MIKIDHSIWTKSNEDVQPELEQWHDGKGVTLTISTIGYDPDLYPVRNDINAVRLYYRDIYAQQGIGIIECGLDETCGFTCATVLCKKINQGQPAVYAGSIAIPLQDKSYVLTIYARESGMTGVRDATVLSIVMAKGEITVNRATGEMPGWAEDPYFPDFEGPCLRTRSDLADYDDSFPDHPLSLVRIRLYELVSSIEIVE